MTPKVSIQVQDLDGSSMPRVFNPVDSLDRRGAIQLVSRYHAFESDYTIFQRHWSRSSLEAIRSLKQHGVRIVVDADDDYFNVPPHNPAAGDFSKKSVRQAVAEMMKQSDVLTVSTPWLKDRYRALARNIVVLPNTLDVAGPWDPKNLDVIRAKAKTEDGRIAIGWAGCISHLQDFSFLGGYFKSLYQKYGERIVFRFFSKNNFIPPVVMRDLPNRTVFDRMVQYQEWVDIQKYSSALAWLALDIGLAPVVHNDFNLARSNLKWLEYSAAGAAVIASELEPYKMIAPSEGVQAANRGRDWLEQTIQLIENEPMRRSLVERSRARIYREYTSETAAAIYLNEVLRERRASPAYSIPDPKPAACDQVPVDIVIPVYNAPAATRRCLLSTLEAIPAGDLFRVVVVDDCGPEAQDYPVDPRLSLHRNRSNLGFVGSCNRAAGELTRTEADILLLNSDTMPEAGFVQKLRQTAYSDASIGTVTAISNHASIATVPDVSDIHSLLERESFPPVVTPTAVGFCLYIKREVLRKYPLFLSDFGKGYGEENDFSMRIRHEYRSVIDPGCFVWHEGHASFETAVDHIRLVTEKHPAYPFEVVNFHMSDPLREVRKRILSQSRDPRPRILNVVHSYNVEAGTEKHVRDLGRALADEFLVFTASPNTGLHTLNLFIDEELVSSKLYYHPGWPVTKSDMPGSETAWNRLLDEIRPSVIHVHHLLNHPLNLLDRLTNSGIPVIVSLHDAYLVCPDWQLFKCPGTDQCSSCFVQKFTEGDHHFQNLRRDILRQSLEKCSAIVAPSQFIADKLREVYPGLQIQIVSHGIDTQALSDHPVRRPGPLRFGFVGNLTDRKGANELLRAFLALSRTDADAELHIYGATNIDTLPQHPRLISHGSYKNAELPQFIHNIDIGVVPSAYAESYCYTLDELHAAGIPVIVANHGALPERIVDRGNGWLFSPLNADSLRDAMQLAAKSWREERIGYPIAVSVRSIEAMTHEYKKIYKSSVAGKKTPSFVVLN